MTSRSGEFQDYFDDSTDYTNFPNLALDYDSDDGFMGRTIAILYNQSTLVQYGAIAIGVFYLITAIGLIVYYVTTLGGSAAGTLGRSSGGGSWWAGYSDRRESIDVSPWLLILAELEAAFAKYGVVTSERDCRQRLVCEAYKMGAVTVNKMAAITISQAIGKLTPEVTGTLKGEDLSLVKDLLKAANRGRQGADCSPYEGRCEGRTLATLTAQEGKED